MARKVRQSVSAKMRSMQNDQTRKVNIINSEISVPTDQQNRLINTLATHTGTLIANGATSTQASWQLVPTGMTDFINNLTVDGAVANVITIVLWSEDGTTQTGKTDPTVLSAGASVNKTSTQWYPVGGTWYKVAVYNGDASPHTCSANIKFRP